MYVFLCKQKTAYEMRISDWSSDVCSSDLQGVDVGGGGVSECELSHGGPDFSKAGSCRSGGSRELCSLPCEGRGGLGRGALGIVANRDHPLPASPCRRRGRGQGESSRLKPALHERSRASGQQPAHLAQRGHENLDRK